MPAQHWIIDYSEDNDFRASNDVEPSEQELNLMRLRGQRRKSRSLLSVETDNEAKDGRRSHKSKRKGKKSKKKNKKKVIKNKFILTLVRTMKNNTEEHLETEINCKHTRLYPNNTFVRDLVTILNDNNIKVINNGRVFERNKVTELSKDKKVEKVLKKMELRVPPEEQDTTSVTPALPQHNSIGQIPVIEVTIFYFNNVAHTPRILQQIKAQWGILKKAEKKKKCLERKKFSGGGPPPTTDPLTGDDIAVWLPHEFTVDSNELDLDIQPVVAPARPPGRAASTPARSLPGTTAALRPQAKRQPRQTRDSQHLGLGGGVPTGCARACYSCNGSRLTGGAGEFRRARSRADCRDVPGAGARPIREVAAGLSTWSDDYDNYKRETSEEKVGNMMISVENSHYPPQSMKSHFGNVLVERLQHGRPHVRTQNGPYVEPGTSEAPRPRAQQPVKLVMKSNLTFNLGDEFFNWRQNADDVAQFLGELGIPLNTNATRTIVNWTKPLKIEAKEQPVVRNATSTTGEDYSSGSSESASKEI
ncbi:hypothetical protein RR48_08551 [Papilio machaon]|uniref:Uncharacterized protein n=1 Tax=Papilio machaon TaxID=76193 RepID=A0A194RJ49_PAPMA|nr:hypothetical protein RR48_08551 [Papilio machaon]